MKNRNEKGGDTHEVIILTPDPSSCHPNGLLYILCFKALFGGLLHNRQNVIICPLHKIHHSHKFADMHIEGGFEPHSKRQVLDLEYVGEVVNRTGGRKVGTSENVKTLTKAYIALKFFKVQ